MPQEGCHGAVGFSFEFDVKKLRTPEAKTRAITAMLNGGLEGKIETIVHNRRKLEKHLKKHDMILTAWTCG